MRKITAKDAALSALFAALLAVCSQLSIPFPGVPLTLQTFAVALCGFTLGYKRAPLSLAVYLMLGLIGVPVFASFRGGVQVLFGPTGGFLFGFLPMTFFCGFGENKAVKRLLFGSCGLALCHAAGTLQYAAITQTPVFAAWTLVSVPFLAKDAFSLCLAFLTAQKVKRVSG